MLRPGPRGLIPSSPDRGPKLIRYRIADLREYAKGQPMVEGMRRCAQAALVAPRLSPKEG